MVMVNSSKINYHVSPSQINIWESCERKWGWSYIAGKKVTGPAQLVGKKVHAGIENYLLHKQFPKDEFFRPTNKSKLFYIHEIVKNGISKLPVKYGDLYCVEGDFEFIYNKIKYVGLIDLYWPDNNLNNLMHVYDHKTSSNPYKWAKTEKEALIDPQLIIYSYYIFLEYPEIDTIIFSFNYIDTYHNRNHSHVTRANVKRDYVLDKMQNHINPIGKKIINAQKNVSNVLDLDYNTNACSEYGGCPYISDCNLSISQMLTGGKSWRKQCQQKKKCNKK